MATVFLAEDERLGRQVAVKRLHADSPEDVARRFDREARLGASLNHPNLVAVYDTVVDPEGVLIVMEYVEGTQIAAALSDRDDGNAARRRVGPGGAAAAAGGAAAGAAAADGTPAADGSARPSAASGDSDERAGADAPAASGPETADAPASSDPEGTDDSTPLGEDEDLQPPDEPARPPPSTGHRTARARPPAPAPAGRSASRPSRRRWLAPIGVLLVVAVFAGAAIIGTVGGAGGGGETGGDSADTEAGGDQGGGGESSGGTGGGGGQAAPPAASAPVQTVTSFYERAAADDFDGAWALAGPGFRSQQGGYESFRGGLSTLESIRFEQAELVGSGGESAQVAIRTVATHSDGVDRCQGTLGLNRGGQSGWLIDRADTSCPESTRG